MLTVRWRLKLDSTRRYVNSLIFRSSQDFRFRAIDAYDIKTVNLVLLSSRYLTCRGLRIRPQSSISGMQMVLEDSGLISNFD
jgi:hypothetical protein